MQKRYLIFLWLVFLLIISNAAISQPLFKASVAKNVIGKNETVELSLLIENAKKPESITPPTFKNFKVLNGPVQQSGEITINGSLRSFVGYVFILKPISPGVFTIPSAIAKADGITLKSNTVKIKVKDIAVVGGAGQLPFAHNGLLPENEKPQVFTDDIIKKGEDVKTKIAKNLFIKVAVDKHSCYVGEPVAVTYKLYSRLGENSDIVTNPGFNGFSVIDLYSGDTYSRIEKIQGRDYYVYTIRKAQLYPLQAGEQMLEKAVIESRIRFKQWESIKHLYEDGTIEYMPNSTNASRHFDTTVLIESEPLQINVKPLPENKPAAFNGAVGNFKIDAFIESDSISTDDAGKLTFMLSGQGNITLIPAPEIKWPKGIEGFEPTMKDGINKTHVPVSGNKIFVYAFTVANAGAYSIPPVVFSYFDIDSGKYKTIRTQPLTLHVTKGTGKKAPLLLDKAAQEESLATKMFTQRWMIVLPIAIFIVLGLWFWLRFDNKRQKHSLSKEATGQEKEEEKQEAIYKIPLNPLQQSEQALLQNDAGKFYECINTELQIFIAGKLQVPLQTISKRAIAEAMDKLGAPVNENLALQKLLDEIALQLYTPFADENNMQAHYVEAVRLITNINNTRPATPNPFTL